MSAPPCPPSGTIGYVTDVYHSCGRHENYCRCLSKGTPTWWKRAHHVVTPFVYRDPGQRLVGVRYDGPRESSARRQPVLRLVAGGAR